MRWLRVEDHGYPYYELLPEGAETERILIAAVAAASYNSAWPEGYGWEQWDPTTEATLDNVRAIMPEVFRRSRGNGREVLIMDYVHGRRCKTYVYRGRRGSSPSGLSLDAGTYEATRGDAERLLRAARDLLAARPRRRGRAA